MNKKELKEFILDLFQVWQHGDRDRLPSFYDKNIVAYSDFKRISLEDIFNRFEFAQKKFLEIDHGVQDLFVDEEEGKIAIRMKQNLTLREDTSQVLSCEVISIYKVVDYKITEILMSFYPNIDYCGND